MPPPLFSHTTPRSWSLSSPPTLLSTLTLDDDINVPWCNGYVHLLALPLCFLWLFSDKMPLQTLSWSLDRCVCVCVCFLASPSFLLRRRNDRPVWLLLSLSLPLCSFVYQQPAGDRSADGLSFPIDLLCLADQQHSEGLISLSMLCHAVSIMLCMILYG